MTRRGRSRATVPFFGKILSLLLAASCALCVPSFADGRRPRHGRRTSRKRAARDGRTRDRFLFDADDGTFGKELWSTSGPGATPLLVADINAGGGSSNPGCFAVLGDRVYFAANDGVHGGELWSSDGTQAGTRMVADLVTAAGEGSAPAKLVAGRRRALFEASDASGDRELWKSDGTAEGTTLLRDIRPGPAGSRISSIVPVGGRVFFSADDGVHGVELWTSDGTADGTRLVRDIRRGGGGSMPSGLVAGRGEGVSSWLMTASRAERYGEHGTRSGTRPAGRSSRERFVGLPTWRTETAFSSLPQMTASTGWSRGSCATGTILRRSCRMWLRDWRLRRLSCFTFVGKPLLFPGGRRDSRNAALVSDGDGVRDNDGHGDPRRRNAFRIRFVVRRVRKSARLSGR
jgi:ELWxxDGT repeat protein